MLHFMTTNATVRKILRIRVSRARYRSLVSKEKNTLSPSEHTSIWHVESWNV